MQPTRPATGPLQGRRVAYAPYATDLSAPGDRRRFAWYAARRGIPLLVASPKENDVEVAYVTSLGDITGWARYDGPAKIVFELVDSYLAEERPSPRSMLRGAARWATGATSRPLFNFREGLRAIARRADAVVCSTDEQREVLADFCPNVHVVLDTYHEYGEAVKTEYSSEGPLRLVWEGLPENLAGFESIASVLAEVHCSRPLSLDVVTSPRAARWMGRYGWRRTEELIADLPIPTTLHDWSPEGVGRVATRADLAVIPLPMHDPFAIGKPENKLLIFWRMGLPVLTAATPAYCRAMHAAGLADMACASPDQWLNGLRRYGAEDQLRAEAGRAGRAFVHAHHTDDQLLRRWDAVFASLG